MSGHADTIRTALRTAPSTAGGWAACKDAEDAVDELVAELVAQGDRIAWLEGEVAGWRIKLAECEERQR